jgi:hypothetical protein
LAVHTSGGRVLELAMVDLRGRPERAASGSTVLAWAMGITTVLLVALVLARRDLHPPFTSRFECGSDPQDILRVGEKVEAGSLRFIVAAHCADARYTPDGRFELRYDGSPFDVQTRRVDIAGTTYYEIVSVKRVPAR